ncbi:MAG: NTP transferase domain-containing protein [Flavobacteriales bacterium]|nr:NTP transferase domain-containing protein [Flavobacteriales bacterium]
MSKHKALLRVDGYAFHQIITKKYHNCDVEKQIIVVNDELAFLKKSVVNNDYEKGRIYSLQLGLQEVNSDWYFIQNIDNPFVSESLINQLINCPKEAEIIQAIYKNQKGHPILISEKVKQEVLKENNYNLTLRDVFSRFEKQQIKVNDNSILININTPEDYKKYCH